MPRSFWYALVFGSAVVGCHSAPPTTGSPRPADGGGGGAMFQLVLKPARGGGPEVTAVEARAELRGPSPAGTQPFSIRAPIVYASVTGIADRIQNLEVRDPSGVVPLTSQDDPVNRGGFPFYRHWRAGRV